MPRRQRTRARDFDLVRVLARQQQADAIPVQPLQTPIRDRPFQPAVVMCPPVRLARKLGFVVQSVAPQQRPNVPRQIPLLLDQALPRAQQIPLQREPDQLLALTGEYSSARPATSAARPTSNGSTAPMTAASLLV